MILSLSSKADAHRIDERIDLVHGIEIHFASDDGHTETVAVIANATDHAVEQPLGLRVVEVTEAQRIQLGNGARAHGKDVAVDATNTGRRSLVRLEGTRVVVTLNLERTTDAITDVHNAGVFLACLDQQMRDHPWARS